MNTRRPTRSTRSNEQRPNQSSGPPAKRQRQPRASSRNGPSPASETPQDHRGAQPQQPHQSTGDTQPAPPDHGLDEISKLTLQNYHQAKRFWPIGRIEHQLNQQKSSNHQISAAVIAEGQALMQNLDHSLHMIAMISGVKIDTLKRSLGLMGGTHAENTWHRWLSFAIDANTYPMPARGAPDASELLTIRNQGNSKTYRALTPDQLDVFRSEIFYALGGYPDYSSVKIPEDNMSGDSLILVPEVPKLSPEEEEVYRPIYERLVDQDKVARDREQNTPKDSSAKEEKRSLQCIKKIAQQLVRDHQLVGMDYYLIACSNGSSGDGWCREYTSRDEISHWVSTKANLQEVFPTYCQHKSTIDEVNAVASESNESKTRAPNQSDLDKKELGGLLNERIRKLLGYLPPKGFPRVPDPLFAIKDRKIPIIVERAQGSEMTDEVFLKGFNGMNASERRLWISDIKSGKFQIKKAPIQSNTTGTAASGSNEAGPAGDSNGATEDQGNNQGGADRNVSGDGTGPISGDGTAAIDVDLDGDAIV